MMVTGLQVSGFVTLSFGIILVCVGPIFINKQIIKNVEINPQNELSYTLWKDIPLPIFMSVYFFNVVNPSEVLEGEKPVLEQRGPYVYREYCQKSNITFHMNQTVSFREYRQYHFMRNMSVGDETDVVTIPNMLVLGAAVMLEQMPMAVRVLASSMFKNFKEGPFLTKTVGELLWGYDSKLVEFLNLYFPGLLPTSGKFGLLAEFNNSNTGMFTVFTGQDDIRKVHQVDLWNGMKEVNYWRTRECNMINGTMGELWPPFMTPESTLPFYSPDACRSMELVYQRQGKVNGIPVFRFVAPKTLFANGSDYSPNEGFCPCRQSGIMNISSCRNGAPVFISQPHFFNGDPSLQDTVEGLDPSEDEHGLFIDIHPETGVPLKAAIRLQLNLYTKAVSGITETDRISEVVLPIVWFEQSGFVDGPVLHTFYTDLVVLPALMMTVQYVFIGLGVVTIFGALFQKLRKKKHGGMKKATLFPPDTDPINSTSEGSPLLQDTVD